MTFDELVEPILATISLSMMEQDQEGKAIEQEQQEGKE